MTKKQLFLLLACTALTGFAATSAIAYDDYADRNRLPSVELNLGTLDNLHSQPTTQKKLCLSVRLGNTAAATYSKRAERTQKDFCKA